MRRALHVCTTVCPNLALKYYEVEPISYQLQKVKITDGKIEILEGKTFSISQPVQILHLADWCNQCGNCTTFCPTEESPYLEKPHQYFSKKAFDEADEGYWSDAKNSELLGKKSGQEFSLKEKENCFLFRIKDIEISISKQDFRIIDVQSKGKMNCEIDMRIAVEMSLVMQGII